MKEFLKRLFEIYKPFKKAVVTLFVFLIFTQVLALAHPWIYGKIIDAIVQKQAFKEIMVLAFVALGLYIIHSVIMSYYRESYEVNNLDYDVRRHVSKVTMEKVMDFSIGQHRNENSGIKQSIMDKGEHSLSTLAYTILYDISPTVLQTGLTIAILMYLSVPLGIITLVGAALFIYSAIQTNFKMKPAMKELEDMYHKNGKLHSEMLRNVEAVQVNAQEKKAINECDSFFGKICDMGKEVWSKYLVTVAGRNVITSVTRFLIIAVGAYYVCKGVYTPGQLVVFLSWSGNVFGKISNVGQIQRRCMELYTSVKKYFVMLDVAPEVVVVANPVRPKKFEGKIEFKNVSFKYPIRRYLEEDEGKNKSQKKCNSDALADINLTIEPGQKVAFVGHSGAGKTTIAQLLIRAYDPDQGQVIIDGNDLRVLDLKYFRENIGLVEQDVNLFDETLKYNILFGLNGKASSITDDELARISELSCIDKFKHRLEDGFETIIGEKGIKLSGGERQRVGIARALIKYPQFMVFDEATSHLDSENEELIHRAIDRASKGRTTIIIAHRLSTVKNADKIFVMDKGRIVGEGSHDELMENCEAYQNLVNKQLVTI